MNIDQVLKLSLGDTIRRAEQFGLMAEDTAASPFGCCNFFDNCADQILSLYYKGKLDLLDWMGFEVSEDCYRSVEFITYDRPAQYQGRDTVGYLEACEDPNGIEYGECKITVEDFGRIGREGPTRDLYKPTRFCKLRPKYFLDGDPVTNEFDWDMIFTMDQILNDVRKLLITGNASTPGQFDGLQQWINTGRFSCKALDSWVIDWNHNPFDGGAGVTINGNPATGTYNIVDYLLDIHRTVKQRVSWSPVLGNQKRKVGDTIVMLPSFLGRALLDYYACWSVCPSSYSSQVSVSLKDQREFRLTMDGGLFGFGKIWLDGDEIPLLFYDWETISGPTCGDVYYLTGSIGSQRIWEGEHLSADIAMKQLSDSQGNPGDYFSRDGGRVMGKVDFMNTCRTLKAWIRPRLFCLAPWAQARITDVCAGTPLGPLSPDPAKTSFFPMDSSFVPASCPGMEPGSFPFLIGGGD